MRTQEQVIRRKSFWQTLDTETVTYRIGYVVLWQTLCGVLTLVAATILLFPTFYSNNFAFAQSIIDTLSNFSSSKIFRWATPQFVDASLIILLSAYGGTLIAQLPGLMNHQARARLTSLALQWLGVLLSGFFVLRQMTVNKDTLNKLIGQDAGQGFLHDLGIFGNSLTLDRIELGLGFAPVFVGFALAAFFLFNVRVGEHFGETAQQREAINAYLYISPYLFIASIFTVALLVLSFYLSFNSLDLGSPATWVGLENYREAFQDPRFLTSIANVVWYAIIVVTLQTSIALLLAALMNGEFAGKRFFRTVFYAPSVTSSVVISLIFFWLFIGPGYINNLLFTQLKLAPVVESIGIDVKQIDQSLGVQWYETADRLGDLTYLRPFFNGNWQVVFGISAVALLILLGTRIWLWVANRRFNVVGIQWLLSGTALFAALISLVLIAVQNYSVKQTLQTLPEISLAALALAAIAVNRRKPAENIITAAHNVIFAGLAWYGVVLVLSVLGGGSDEQALSTPIRIIGWASIGILIGIVVAQSTYRGNRSTIFLSLGEVDTRIPSLVGQIARFGGVTLPTLITFFIAVLVFFASETTGYKAGTQMPSERFAAILARGPSVAFMTIMVQNIFTTAPTFMLMYLAALQDLPKQLYEAAEIDGANRWQRFRLITIPMLSPVTLLIVVLGTIGTFQLFDQVKVLTEGEPFGTTLVPVYLIYTTVLGNNVRARVGYASAMAFVLGAIIFAFTFIQRRYIESGTEQY